MTKLIIEGIPLSDVHNYNTSNHWVNNCKPVDYDSKSEETYTHHWIDKFHTNYNKIIINDLYHISWLKEANKLGKITGVFPSLFKEERDELVHVLNECYKNIFDQEREYFIRVENVSLKSGCHGVGPYNNFKNVIESLVTCRQGHSPFDQEVSCINLYMISWKESLRDEFRVFVYDGRITAISQQNLYKKIYDDESDVYKICSKLVEHYYSELQSKIDWIKSKCFVYDVALTDDVACGVDRCGSKLCLRTQRDICGTRMYFIEPNPFGKEYTSGSGLFHWIEDEEILSPRKSNSNGIVIRYTV